MLYNDFYVDLKNIVIAHEFTIDKTTKCEYPNKRGSYGLIYALEGEAEYRFSSGKRITIKKNNALFLSPDASYSLVSRNSFRHYTINFLIHEKSSALFQLNKSFYLVTEEHTEPLEHLFKRTANLWQTKKNGYAMQAVGTLYELLYVFYSDYVQKDQYKSYHRLMPAREYINEHFAEEITLSQLAYLSNMSLTNFRREWKKFYSLPPLAYKNSLRLPHAKELLSSGYYSVSETASKCGFEDPSYFIRFFKKETGMTPKDFKYNSL